MFLAGREPNHVARPNLLHRSAFFLRPAATRRYEESLPKRMGVCQAVRAPGSKVTIAAWTRAGVGACCKGSIRTAPVNQSGFPLAEGCVPARLISIRLLYLTATGDDFRGQGKVRVETLDALAFVD
jgi:hypothetical protein